ncbi:hypothetical protein BHM03_00050228 [Ensete ventricosum]|nr:hypothetical protein BHM03_00050228 [Ensete ventricosum]
MSTGIDGTQRNRKQEIDNRNPTRAVYYYDYDYDDRGSPTGNVGGLHGRTRDQVSGGDVTQVLQVVAPTKRSGCNVDDGSHDVCVYRNFNAGTFFYRLKSSLCWPRST